MKSKENIFTKTKINIYIFYNGLKESFRIL